MDKDNLPAEPKRVFGLPQQRQKAVEILNHCYSNDLLDLLEFESRLALAEKAVTLDDLERVLADIPEEHRNPGVSAVGVTEAETVIGTMSTKRVSDGVLLTKVLEAQVTMGTLVLDYRHLALPEGVLEVRLKASMSNCRIHLPEGVGVELRLQETMSKVKEQHDYAFGSRKPRTILRLTGEAHMPTVKILRRSRFSVWLEHLRGPKELS
jgi:hypothetical protein